MMGVRSDARTAMKNTNARAVMTERKPSPLNLRKVPASSDGQTKRVSPKSTYYETVNPANLLRGLKVSVVSERRFRLIAAE